MSATHLLDLEVKRLALTRHINRLRRDRDLIIKQIEAHVAELAEPQPRAKDRRRRRIGGRR